VHFIEYLSLKILKVAAGGDHSLLLAIDEKGRKKLYSIGKQDEKSTIINKALGVSAQEATDSICHEIIAFNDLDIVDFSATTQHSIVIMKGEESPTENVGTHKLP
jgi:alpha-tubulin suppressor-like RCC1 family protein